GPHLAPHQRPQRTARHLRGGPHLRVGLPGHGGATAVGGGGSELGRGAPRRAAGLELDDRARGRTYRPARRRAPGAPGASPAPGAGPV
ncbi:MAG: hypothetical protein AVDCRST_MAG50-3018, partial [uncultured Acidimicrobiales bacterium]